MPIPRGQKATRRCQQCHRDFFGDTCFQMHLVKDSTGKPASNPQSTICSQRRRCPACRKQNVGLDQIEKHRCHYIDCPSCHEYVDGETHRCFIQTAPKPQANKKKRKRTTETVPEDEVPPLHVFFDIEAMQPQEKHIANLVVAETEGRRSTRSFRGRALRPRFPRMVGYLDPQRYPPSQCPGS